MAAYPGRHVLKFQADLEWKENGSKNDILLAVCTEGNDGCEGNVQ